MRRLAIFLILTVCLLPRTQAAALRKAVRDRDNPAARWQSLVDDRMAQGHHVVSFALDGPGPALVRLKVRELLVDELAGLSPSTDSERAAMAVLSSQFPGFAAMSNEPRLIAARKIAALQARADLESSYATGKAVGKVMKTEERILREVLGYDDAAIDSFLRKRSP